MALLNTDTITDISAIRLIEKDTELKARLLANTDLEIRAACRIKGIIPEDIPVDVEGYATSEALQLFGQKIFLSEAMLALKNSVAIDDGYGDKALDYADAAEKKRKGLTYETITGNDENRAANLIGSKPLY